MMTESFSKLRTVLNSLIQGKRIDERKFTSRYMYNNKLCKNAQNKENILKVARNKRLPKKECLLIWLPFPDSNQRTVK